MSRGNENSSEGQEEPRADQDWFEMLKKRAADSGMNEARQEAFIERTTDILDGIHELALQFAIDLGGVDAAYPILASHLTWQSPRNPDDSPAWKFTAEKVGPPEPPAPTEPSES